MSTCLSLIDSFSFFFSSRRRHTRYIGDWSSDVCSSDLVGNRAVLVRAGHAVDAKAPGRVMVAERAPHPRGLDEQLDRSEERRVGKECRYRDSLNQQKKEDERISQ